MLLGIGYFKADDIVKRQLEKTIKTLPKSIQLNYANLSVDVLEGTLAVKKPELIITEEAKNTLSFHVKLQDFILKDVSFWDYLVHNSIHLTDLILQDSEVVYIKNDSIPETSTAKPSNKSLKEFNKSVKIDKFNLSNAKVTIFQNSKDSIYLQTEGVNFAVQNLIFNKETAVKGIPIDYEGYKITTDSLMFQVGVFEKLRLESLELTHKNWQINQLEFKTIYSKTELSRKIKKERDHFNVTVDAIVLNEPNFGFENKRLYFKSQQVEFETPSLKIYRDKLVADDPTIKPLYSEMLRNLSFDLTLGTVQLKNGFIQYQEKVKSGARAGEVVFEDFNATIKNVSNTYVAPTKTEMDVNSVFMHSAQLHAFWTFDVNDKDDKFTFKTEISGLPAYRLNQFVESNLNVRVQGTFNKVFATIQGNVDRSRFNFDAKYTNVKVHVLNKRHKKDKLLSGLANLFIHQDSKDDKGGVVGQKNVVIRDKTKSVFNFIWKNIQEGLKQSLVSVIK